MSNFVRLAAILIAIFCNGLLAFSTLADETKIPEYKTVYDNIPANWEPFYVHDDFIESHKGDKVSKITMTKHTIGKPGDGTLFAGGHLFTVIGEREILLKDENDETFLIVTRKCRSLKRAKHLLLPNDVIKFHYRRSSFLSVATTLKPRISQCDIYNMYEWNGPTYYLDNIEYTERVYRNKVRHFR